MNCIVIEVDEYPQKIRHVFFNPEMAAAFKNQMKEEGLPCSQYTAVLGQGNRLKPKLESGKLYILKTNNGQWIIDAWTEEDLGYFEWNGYGLDEIAEVIPLQEILAVWRTYENAKRQRLSE